MSMYFSIRKLKKKKKLNPFIVLHYKRGSNASAWPTKFLIWPNLQPNFLTVPSSTPASSSYNEHPLLSKQLCYLLHAPMQLF